jgi:hypothetical protein
VARIIVNGQGLQRALGARDGCQCRWRHPRTTS